MMMRITYLRAKRYEEITLQLIAYQIQISSKGDLSGDEDLVVPGEENPRSSRREERKLSQWGDPGLEGGKKK
jgi:hypothetical protein